MKNCHKMSIGEPNDFTIVELKEKLRADREIRLDKS
jgi:hypothetical protein